MEGKRSRKRSEKVRRRIKQESKEWINQASRRITDPNPGFSPFQAVNDIKNGQPVGHAVQDQRFFRLGWRLLSFVLVCAISFALVFALFSPLFELKNIRINGLNRLDQDEIIQEIGLVGKRIFEINTSVIEKQLREFYPEFRDVRVSLGLPAIVVIKVVERQPEIAWINSGTRLWIDSEGYLIPARGEAQIALVINGDSLPDYHLALEDESISERNLAIDKPAFKETFPSALFFILPKQIDGNLLKAILQLNAWMPEEDTLLYQKIRGVGWRDIRGWDVFIGSKLENINDKMLLYETIVRTLETQGIQPGIVSVEFLHAPYYRLGNDHG